MFKLTIERILVARGAEYTAVCRGLKKSGVKGVEVIPIPMGVAALTRYLQEVELSPKPMLLLGLSGSINPEYGLGNIVIYEECYYQDKSGKLLKKDCNSNLKTMIEAKLSTTSVVKGLTCDRLINTAVAKAQNRGLTGADVVDMESWVMIQNFPSVAIVRVISDNYEQSLPDLNSTLDNQGNLNPFSLALKMSQQPLASLELIRSSLKALGVLEKITTELFLE
jgi:nucleoside phosphorylase